MKDFDVIIIGSGIGGLVSAGILASAGLKTLVIERHNTAGGYMSSFTRKGFVFDSAVDCIAGVARGGLIHRALELLGIEKELRFIRVDPIRLSIFPGLEIEVDADIDVYRERLMMLFPSEAVAIRNFFSKIGSVYAGLQAALGSVMSGRLELNGIPRDALRLMENSYLSLLNDYFTDHRLKAALSDRCPFIGLPPSGVSAVAMINMIMSYFTLGAYRAEGGFQQLADAFVRGIQKKGGQVIFNKGVKSILMDSGDHCSGVRCDDGEEYAASHIISNADFNHTFGSLIGGRYAYLAGEMMRSPGISTSFFIVYAGLQGKACVHSSIGLFPSFDMESFFSGDMAFREDTTIGFTSASVEDSSRAPKGCSTVTLHEMVEPGADIDKTACVEKILTKAENIIPDIRDRIVFLDAATPQTLQRYTGNYGGAAFGWRQIPGFRGGQRHGIKNLHTAGHWGDMGGGVLAAAYSGAKAAGAVLAKEGIKNVI